MKLLIDVFGHEAKDLSVVSELTNATAEDLEAHKRIMTEVCEGDRKLIDAEIWWWKGSGCEELVERYVRLKRHFQESQAMKPGGN